MVEYVPRELQNTKLTWVHYIYFSGMALTTVGYGDIHPKTDCRAGLILSVIEAIMGYIMLGLFVAVLVGIDEAVLPPYSPDWKEDLFSKLI